MELRGQDKEMGMPSSFSFNNQLNRDSSLKVSSSSSAPINSAVGKRIRDQTVHGEATIFNQNPHQTLDHQPIYHPQLIPQHQVHKARRDPDPEPDLDPAPAPDPISASTATASATVTPTANRSISQQQPPPVAVAPAPTSTTSSSSPLIRYRECLKNHAASMGGHVMDGCGEFMPSGEEGTPEALKCAACECHRNFHRKEINGESQYAPTSYYPYNPNKNNARRDTLHHHHHHPPQQQRFPRGLSTSPSAMPMAPIMMNFGGGSGGGGPAESSSEDLNMFPSNAGGRSLANPESSKKRFRTKFNQDQKDRMMGFAEKLGWRIQKQDEQEVQQFCAQVGVRRQVFKVWMHNNKQAMKKKQL